MKKAFILLSLVILLSGCFNSDSAEESPVELPVTPSPTPSTVIIYYGTCAEARAAGNAPMNSDNPGYRPALDQDGDGIACD